VIPKIHILGFCFIATASTRKEFMVLRSLHRLSPLAQRFSCIDTHKKISIYFGDSRDVYHCPLIFSRSTDFAAPPGQLDFARVGCLIHRLGWVVDRGLY
jgi:hypothetical protein